MYIIPTTKAVHVAKRLQEMNQNVILPTGNRDNKSHFPDGELYARVREIEELSGERIVVLHSGQPNPNSGLVELYSILEILNNPISSFYIKDKEYEYSPVKNHLQSRYFSCISPTACRTRFLKPASAIWLSLL